MPSKKTQGRPRKYPKGITNSERQKLLDQRKRKAGWKRVSLWLAPGVDREQVKNYVEKKNKTAQQNRA